MVALRSNAFSDLNAATLEPLNRLSRAAATPGLTAGAPAGGAASGKAFTAKDQRKSLPGSEPSFAFGICAVALWQFMHPKPTNP